ncbi:DNA-binding MarR family transcriptional regulator [Methanolobus bombayensis]|nr:DNA-binding MarR family transcriptional regulator [Methanolobus bombayensis]
MIFENLFKIKSECSSEILCGCGLPDITLKQIGYLKVIDSYGEITFSKLAEVTSNSKPTISEMINKFIRMECVYKKKSPDDGRVFHICLTEKGQTICRSEQRALFQLTEKMMYSLTDDEVKMLVGILEKVK